MNRRRIYTLTASGVLGAGILVVTRLLVAPARPLAFTEPRPVFADNKVVAHTEEIWVELPLDQYNAWSATTPLESILPGSDDIPSVVRTDMLQGTWGDVGARRRVVLSDGHYAAEEILATSRTQFHYQVWGYTNALRFLTDYASGEFRMKEVGNRTHITWTYSFHRQSPVTDVVLEIFVRTVWADYMRSVLQLMKEKSEEAATLQTSGG